MKITLNAKELLLLQKAAKEGENETIISPIPLTQYKFCLSLSDDQSTDLRENCMDYLMMYGFDENYNPTEEGAILENLIDKLYIP